MSQTKEQKKEPFELDVTYPSTCPECLKSGQTVSLGFSFKRGGIFCATGAHQFDSVPGEAQAPAAQAKTEERKPAIVDEPSTPEPTPTPAALTEADRGHVEVTYTRPLAGGDIEVTLRIPDRHAQAVRAEAEVQKQTLEQYLQTWIEAALDNFWSR